MEGLMGQYGRNSEGKWSEHMMKAHEKTMTIEQAMSKIVMNSSTSDNISFLSFE